MNKLDTGDLAPEFEAVDQNENSVKRSDYQGRKIFLFFYPKANTSG